MQSVGTTSLYQVVARPGTLDDAVNGHRPQLKDAYKLETGWTLAKGFVGGTSAALLTEPTVKGMGVLTDRMVKAPRRKLASRNWLCISSWFRPRQNACR